MKSTKMKICIFLFLGTLVSITFVHVYLLDGIDGWLFGILFAEDEDTFYASGYSEKAFRQIHLGMSRLDVVNLLGRPLIRSWLYQDTEQRELRVWLNDDGKVNHVYLDHRCKPSSRFTEIEEGMRQERVRGILGKPVRESWAYSKSPGSSHFRIRTIMLKDGIVIKKFHEFYVD